MLKIDGQLCSLSCERFNFGILPIQSSSDRIVILKNISRVQVAFEWDTNIDVIRDGTLLTYQESFSNIIFSDQSDSSKRILEF
jgi:hypothetical protein